MSVYIQHDSYYNNVELRHALPQLLNINKENSGNFGSLFYLTDSLFFFILPNEMVVLTKVKKVANTVIKIIITQKLRLTFPVIPLSGLNVNFDESS